MGGFTPGPWVVNGNLIESDEWLVAFVDPKADLPWKANAGLMAAAPDLLDALRYVRSLIGPDEIVDAAIAKAGATP